MALARFEHDFTDDAGNLIGVAGTVTVRREDTGALAAPYSDRDGTTGLGNPFAVSDGQVAFHVIGGSYKITLTYGGETRELRYVAIGTAAEQDAEALGKAGYAFEFEAATTAPPSASSIRANNADLSLATKLYIDDETLGESDISALLLALDPGANTTKDRVRLTVGAVDAVFDVDAATDQTNYVELDVSGHAGATSLSVGTCRVEFELAGRDGVVAQGVHLAFSTTTTNSDPGAGIWRADNATEASISALYIDNADQNSADITSILDSLDDVTNANSNAIIRFQKTDDATSWVVFKVKGAVVDETGYRTVPVEYLAGALPSDTDVMAFSWSVSGADGVDGGGLKGISVRAASDSNINLTTDLEAGDSAGGVTLAAGDVFGAFGQTDASENGIWVAQASGAAVRHASFDTWDEIAGGVFPVREGTLEAYTFINTDSASGGTIDTNDLSFVSSSGLADNSVTNAKLTEAHSLALSHTVADRTALKALDTARYNVVFMQGLSGGLFVWDGSDLSTEVAADTQEGIYVSSGDGSGGAWVRDYEGPVSVLWFGAPIDGSDATSVLTTINTIYTKILFPADHTYELVNWVPAADTEILAHGATINRYDDTEYGATGSSAAVVATSSGLRIRGGTWGLGANGTRNNNYTGSIVVEDGDCEITDAKIAGTWGGIFGHVSQNGSKTCSRLRIQNCEITSCAHNTWLADLDNLEFIGNWSYDSDRDGLRTFRNIKNVLIQANHFYSNGNGTAGQSRDGIDLYFGGKRCVVIGNFIYDNESSGIDIKRGSDSAGETVFGQEFIIIGNHIFGNASSGISIEQNMSPVQYNENVTILGNHVRDNGDYGCLLENIDNLILEANHVHESGDTGARLVDVRGGVVKGNTVFDNTGVGINVFSSCNDIIVEGNTSFDSGVATQTIGIFHSASGVCRGNNCYGNTNTQINSSVTDGSLKGERLTARLDSTDSGFQYVGSPSRNAVVVGAKLVAGATSDVDVGIRKRDALTGAFEGTIYTSTAESFTAHLPEQLGSGTWDSSERKMLENELIYADLANATSSFTMGLIEIEMAT